MLGIVGLSLAIFGAILLSEKGQWVFVLVAGLQLAAFQIPASIHNRSTSRRN